MWGRKGIGIGAVVAALAACAIALPADAKAGFYLGEHAPTAPERPGVVITVHGGAWAGNYGADADTLMSTYINEFRSYGYRVYNLAHRPDHKSVPDMLTAVRRVSRKNPGRPVCLFGGSSGGHLVLLAAIELPELVDCVIDQAGIPDLINPDTAPVWQAIRSRAVEIWGRRNLREVSPMQRARRIRAPVLVTAIDCDQITSMARQQKLVAKLRRGQIFIQEGGDGYNTGHCEVSYASIAAMWRNYDAFLAQHAG